MSAVFVIIGYLFSALSYSFVYNTSLNRVNNIIASAMFLYGWRKWPGLGGERGLARIVCPLPPLLAARSLIGPGLRKLARGFWMYRPQMRYGWKIKAKLDDNVFGTIRRALAHQRRISGSGKSVAIDTGCYQNLSRGLFGPRRTT